MAELLTRRRLTGQVGGDIASVHKTRADNNSQGTAQAQTTHRTLDALLVQGSVEARATLPAARDSL